MTTPLAVKRRKLNETPSKLLKPFVSPLRISKTNPPAPKQTLVNTTSIPQPYLPSTAAHTISTQSPPLHTTIHRPVRSSPFRKPGFIQPQLSRPLGTAEIAIQKEVRSLEQQIRQVQADIDTLQQAKQITQASNIARLKELIAKWRTASQAVADDVFLEVKNRVDQMGGVAAWRESERRKYQRMNGFEDIVGNTGKRKDDEDYEFDSQGEEPGRNERRIQKRRKLLEEQDTMETGQKQQDDEDEDTFTMEMMLRSLNIELDVIGYDKDEERWIT